MIIPSIINLKQQYGIQDSRKAFCSDCNYSQKQSDSNNRLKSALKFGGSMALATIAGDAIFFNKNWRGKGKIPTIVNSVLDGAAIGSITALFHYAGLLDDNKTDKAGTNAVKPEESSDLPVQKKTTDFAGRMKTLGIIGAACYVLTSCIELAANKFNDIGKTLGKNALITAGILVVAGTVTEIIKYKKDKAENL